MRWQFCFSVQARSGNILQHLAAELRRAEASGNVDRLVSSGGGNVPRGATYPAPGQGVRRRQSDPDFLAQIAGGQPAQSRRVPSLVIFRALLLVLCCELMCKHQVQTLTEYDRENTELRGVGTCIIVLITPSTYGQIPSVIDQGLFVPALLMCLHSPG